MEPRAGASGSHALAVKLEGSLDLATSERPGRAAVGEERDSNTSQEEHMQFSGRGISSLFAKVCLNPSIYNPR